MFNKLILLGIIFTLIISLIISLGFLFVSIDAFLISFFIVTGVQAFIGYPLNRYLDSKEKILNIYSQLLTEQELLIKTSHTTNIECAYCNTMNNVQININNDYRFKCRKCGEISKVIVNTTSCRTTDLNVIEDIQDVI